MKLQCPVEQDLLDAFSANRWPARADAILREHVAGCTICVDVAAIASAFADDDEKHTGTEIPVPAASAIWWRAQIRAREESARLAARPIALVQAVSTMCVAAVSVAAAPAASAWVRDMIAALGATGWSVPREVSLSWILGTAAYTTLPLLAVGLWIVLAPVVVYLALDE